MVAVAVIKIFFVCDVMTHFSRMIVIWNSIIWIEYVLVQSDVLTPDLTLSVIWTKMFPPPLCYMITDTKQYHCNPGYVRYRMSLNEEFFRTLTVSQDKKWDIIHIITLTNIDSIDVWE